VVEAGLNSGALITATQALEQGRSIYAVPGHINAPSAHGSNRLIQQGAKLVMEASDILDDLEVLLPEAKAFATSRRATAPDAHRRRAPRLRCYRSDRDFDRRHRDQIRFAKRQRLFYPPAP
jgi:predicted Rossmann fold nucleotide-binding protein DprA/Smf involved in DNA uptake